MLSGPGVIKEQNLVSNIQTILKLVKILDLVKKNKPENFQPLCMSPTILECFRNNNNAKEP